MFGRIINSWKGIFLNKFFEIFPIFFPNIFRNHIHRYCSLIRVATGDQICPPTCILRNFMSMHLVCPVSHKSTASQNAPRIPRSGTRKSHVSNASFFINISISLSIKFKITLSALIVPCIPSYTTFS